MLSLLRLSKLVIFVEENGKFRMKWFYSDRRFNLIKSLFNFWIKNLKLQQHFASIICEGHKHFNFIKWKFYRMGRPHFIICSCFENTSWLPTNWQFGMKWGFSAFEIVSVAKSTIGVRKSLRKTRIVPHWFGTAK